MLKTETKIIDGLEFRSTQLPALRSFALLTRLGKVVGPALAKIQDINVPEGMDLGDADIKVLTPVLAELFSSMSPEDAQRLAIESLVSTSVIVDGRIEELTDQMAIDRVFQANIMLLLKAMGFAIKVNFSDFFGALGVTASQDGSDEEEGK